MFNGQQSMQTTDNITHAYHVTNLPWKEEQSPLYEKLHLTLADSPVYEGSLYGIPAVFFAVTLYKGNVPDRTMYPRDAAQWTYWRRVWVPLSYLDLSSDRFRLYHFHDERGYPYTQTRLVFVESGYQTDFGRLLRIVNKEQEVIKPLSKVTDNGYMWWNGANWVCPSSDSNKWINFIVLGQVDIKESNVDHSNTSVSVDILSNNRNTIYWDRVQKKVHKQSEVNSHQSRWFKIYVDLRTGAELKITHQSTDTMSLGLEKQMDDLVGNITSLVNSQDKKSDMKYILDRFSDYAIKLRLYRMIYDLLEETYNKWETEDQHHLLETLIDKACAVDDIGVDETAIRLSSTTLEEKQYEEDQYEHMAQQHADDQQADQIQRDEQQRRDRNNAV